MANTEQKKTNKSRMLFILRYLMQNTNEDHMVSLSDLTDICDDNGFGRPNRRTIISDIRELTESEYPIEVEEIGQTNYFYYSGHLTQSELRVLVDAVEAAQFITKKDSMVLIEKLVKLSNWRDEDYYLNRTLLEGCRKTDNKNMKYILLTIQDAIREKKKIRFQYYDYNLEGEKILHNDGEEIITLDIYGDNAQLIADGVEKLQPFIDEVIPEQEERYKELTDIEINMTFLEEDITEEAG